jgi:hypothetical protein
VPLRIDLGEGVLDPAVRTDDVGDPPRVAVGAVVAGAIRQADLPLRVAQQRIGDREFLREGGVLCDGVEGDAEDRGPFRVELAVQVAVPATFERSSGCVGLRIEPQDHAAAPEIPEARVAAVVILDGESGGLGPDREHGDLLWDGGSERLSPRGRKAQVPGTVGDGARIVS